MPPGHFSPGAASAGAISLAKWCADTGICRVSAYRWRKQGVLQTVNINGRMFVTREADAEFWRRAASGEFAKDRRPPGK